MNTIGHSAIALDKDPTCYVHCAIFLADTSLIDMDDVKKCVSKKVLDPTDQSLLQAGIIGDDVFRVHSIQGQEKISTPFSFEVELHGNTDVPGGPVQIDFDQLIGRPVTLGINLPSETFTENYQLASQRFLQAITGSDVGEVSLFNGIIASFAIKQPGVYSLSVKPALWKLSLTNRYQLYYQKNIKEVIAEVLGRHNIECNLNGISGSDNMAITRTQDWLQAGESDYEFIQRIMGKVHIYYFFQHEPISHTVIFANRPAYPAVFPDGRSLRYAYTEDMGMDQDDVIKDYNYQKTLMSSSVRTVFTTMQNGWLSDPNISYQLFESDSEKNLGELPFQLYRVFQYGGSADETAEYTRQTSNTLVSAKTSFSGASTHAQMRTGYQFTVTSAGATLEGAYPVQPSLEGQAFVLTQVQHHATSAGVYNNQFQATEANGLITPFNMHETRQGSMLAEVVDSSGADTLEGSPWYGAKSDFAPEQSGLTDTLASPPPITLNTQGVYVVLSNDGANAQPFWVKLAPSMQQAPEIGSIVMICRSSDNSEIPEIQNVIHSNGNKTVTPSGWMTNTQVGSNYSTSYGDSKSVRFGKASKADLDSAVNIVQQAYLTEKFKDCVYSQGASYSYSTSEKGKEGILSESVSLGSTYSDHIGAESISYATIDNSYSKQTIKKTESYTTISDKSYSESTIGESESFTTINGASKSTSTIGSAESTSTINTDTTSTSTIIGNATTTNTVMGISDSTSTMNVVKGNSVIVSQTNASLLGSSNNSSLIGSSDNTTIVGSSNAIGVTGTSTGVNVTGSQNSMAFVGSSSSVNLMGSNESVSLIGSATNTSITGSSTNTSITGSSTNTSLLGSGINTNISGTNINTSITGASLNTNITGAAVNTNIAGITADISIAGSGNSLSVKGAMISLDIWGTGVKMGNEAANVGAKTVGTVAEVVAAIKVIL